MNGEKFNSDRAPQAVGLYPHARKVGNLLFLSGVGPRKAGQEKIPGVELDENKIPEKITWSASDGGVENKPSKAVFLSVWDHDPQETLKIDLWTKDMPIDQMNVFFHQTFQLIKNIVLMKKVTKS